jgi:hypothetical protein
MVPPVSPPSSTRRTRTAIIQVTYGALSIPNMISELERLIPTKWTCKVEEVGSNTFKTLFPNKAGNCKG